MDPPTPDPARLSENGWTLSREEAERVYEGLGVSVTAHTAVYEDADLRERIVEAGGEDRVWRFFFASRLDVTPSPGFGMASAARPYVVRESKKTFVEELRERGFEDITDGDTETVGLGGRRGRMTPHRARLSTAGGDVGVLGAVVVWRDGEFHVAGGAYPTSGLEALVDVNADAYETELLELIRAVA